MMSFLIYGFVITMTLAVNPTTDQVIFPDWPQYNFKTYSGYIPVANGLRQLHYIFLESQSDPTTDPVVLWLNGGPGCSSLLGLNEEIGPFVMVDEDRVFKQNPYPWNAKANLLFLESPAGVGFSQNLDPSYQYNDTNSGSDNAEAIRNWFSAFTLFKNRAFWISGESYAGMYIPYTAQAILEANKDSSITEKVSIRGVLIGNGLLVSDQSKRNYALVEYFLRRNFVPPTVTNTIRNICYQAPGSVNCQIALEQFYESCLESNINIYNVYGYCKEDTTPDFLKQSLSDSQKTIRYPYVSWFEGNKYSKGNSGAPCSDFGPITEYYNRFDVQQALNINEQPYFWSACNMDVNANYTISSEGSYQIIPKLYEAGLRVLIYSGDQDAIVSVVDTEQAINMIPSIYESVSWKPWGNSDQDLAGWITEYNYLTFVVIRGAGHMVPEDQRQNGFEMFDNFIYNKGFNKK